MAETLQLGLPLLQPAQAQKHVTVNEALTKLDGLTQLVLASATVVTPPLAAVDGEAYFVPVGAVNAWAGQEGQVAVWSNGGWVFSTPSLGWRGYIADEGTAATFDGSGWVRAALAVSPNGAASTFQVVEFDHAFGAEAVSTPGTQIPQYAMVFAVTGRVKTAITGAVTSFDIGVSGAVNRYGGGIGLAQGSWFVGITGQPVTYYADTPLELTANGGDFAAGEVRLALHYYLPTVPSV
ncbi:hypothetical protein AIOL_001544 [Candidatus Rhodobacter oscarellae]|uniref:DUF2793 domain-containing protein n=1 Tax=Candidatus Rhodobacter oscarellae TaxID=1675527 RepID=A0A0J9E1H5_9RHOB|nr:DUF2793 domain-containing protein [Candidatus Rhodobacter lobularis]KMW56590.1 hypothetical protein AIOL_001544 [Candidatus Rhodobacter lobularis]